MNIRYNLNCDCWKPAHDQWKKVIASIGKIEHPCFQSSVVSQLLVISVIVEAAIALHFDQSEYFCKFCIFGKNWTFSRDVKVAFFHIIKP